MSLGPLTNVVDKRPPAMKNLLSHHFNACDRAQSLVGLARAAVMDDEQFGVPADAALVVVAGENLFAQPPEAGPLAGPPPVADATPPPTKESETPPAGATRGGAEG